MIRHRPMLGLFILLIAALAGPALAQSGFALRDGDRVVFYGDSITDQRLYTTFVEDYVVTRFPRWNIRFIHSGWGGDRVTGGGGGPIDLRLERDVIAYKPTVMTIMLGMNDGGYRRFDAPLFNTYARGYQQIVEKVKRALPGIRLTLIQPSPYDDVTRSPRFEGGYNAVLVRYGQSVQELATKEGAMVADLNTPVVAALQKAHELDDGLSQKLVPDRVHPGPGGHLLMAAALLKAWSAPRVVTAVTIDAAGKRVARQENTRVTALRAEEPQHSASASTKDEPPGGSLSWAQTDDALPMPLDLKDPALALALRASDVVESLDQQTLSVTGLTAPRYTLKIDGEEIGSFTPQQLAEGINLALLPTPMAKQSQSVHALTVRHNDVHFVRWRDVQVPLQEATSTRMPKALAALDALEDDFVQQQHAAARPRPHRYELVPQS
jgi:lysophospholipase L1-like esterase